MSFFQWFSPSILPDSPSFSGDSALATLSFHLHARLVQYICLPVPPCNKYTPRISVCRACAPHTTPWRFQFPFDDPHTLFQLRALSNNTLLILHLHHPLQGLSALIPSSVTFLNCSSETTPSMFFGVLRSVHFDSNRPNLEPPTPSPMSQNHITYCSLLNYWPSFFGAVSFSRVSVFSDLLSRSFVPETCRLFPSSS